MKRIEKNILILILLITSSLYGQSDDSTKYDKFDIGFTFSPDYSYRKLKTDASNTWIKETYDTLEVYRYSYTAGLNIIFHINKNFSFASGLLLADKGERTKKYLIPPANNYVNHYYYLDIPIKINCNFSKSKKVNFFLTAGGSANVYLKSKTLTENSTSGETETINSRPELSRINLSFIAGLGIDCQLTDKWYFKLEPNYRRSVTRVANAPVKKYFYSFGLNLGFFCKF